MITMTIENLIERLQAAATEHGNHCEVSVWIVDPEVEFGNESRTLPQIQFEPGENGCEDELILGFDCHRFCERKRNEGNSG